MATGVGGSRFYRRNFYSERPQGPQRIRTCRGFSAGTAHAISRARRGLRDSGARADGANRFAHRHPRHSAARRDHQGQRDSESQRGALFSSRRSLARSHRSRQLSVATMQLAQTTLRSVGGQTELDELLSQREKLNARIQEIVDAQTEPWGVKVTLVELKNIDLPQDMQRAIAAQAEAERERRAKVILAAEGEFQASQRLADAAEIMSKSPITCSSAICKRSRRSRPKTIRPQSFRSDRSVRTVPRVRKTAADAEKPKT